MENQEQELMQAIITKAWEDEAFKQALLENPVEAIRNATGHTVSVPEGKKLVVRDQTDENTYYINIPLKTAQDDVELTDDQLEAVSGGIVRPGGCTMPIIPVFLPFVIDR